VRHVRAGSLANGISIIDFEIPRPRTKLRGFKFLPFHSLNKVVSLTLQLRCVACARSARNAARTASEVPSERSIGTKLSRDLCRLIRGCISAGRCDFGRSSVSLADNFNLRDRRRERLGVKGSRHARDVSLAHRSISSHIFHNRRIFFFVIAHPRLRSRGLVLAARKRSAARMSANARRRRVSLATRGERDFGNPVPGCSTTNCSQHLEIWYVHLDEIDNERYRLIIGSYLDSYPNGTIVARKRGSVNSRSISAHGGRRLRGGDAFFTRKPKTVSRIFPFSLFLSFIRFLARLRGCMTAIRVRRKFLIYIIKRLGN